MKSHNADVNVDIELTPSELADLFLSMDHIEMRKFFNAISEQIEFTDFSSQIHEVVHRNDSIVVLSQGAKNLLKEMGDSVSS